MRGEMSNEWAKVGQAPAVPICVAAPRSKPKAPQSVPPKLVVRHESTGLSLSSRDKLRAAVLSGVAGYVDAAGLLSVVVLFPAHITGELVTEAVALSSGQRAAGPSRLWMIPVFVVSVALAAVVARIERRAGRAPLAPLLLLVALGLTAFAGSGLLLLVLPSAPAAHVMQLGTCCAVAAMGFQNALMRESLSGSAPTTFMTGNLTQLVIELVEHGFALKNPPGIMSDVARSVSRARLRTAAIALSAFLSSAALGAWLTHALGALGAVLPALLVAGLSFQAYRERREKRAEPVVNQLGMRRPTPISRALNKHTRAESGTRFKAVRPVVSDADPDAFTAEERKTG
jgi:uncharacterized membrane protein YoaK (UPF0700 family)